MITQTLPVSEDSFGGHFSQRIRERGEEKNR